METEQLLNNEYYLLITASGDVMKSKSKKDFEIVKSWESYLFANKVKLNDYVHYLVGSTWRQKQVKRLETSRAFSEVSYFDFGDLDLTIGSRIKQIKIGGKEKPQNYESL